MTDARIQRARRGAAAGDPAEAARVLAERLRCGELTEPKIELAAFCGNKPALLFLGRETFGCLGYDGAFHTHCCRDPNRWAAGLERWEKLGPTKRWLMRFAMTAAARAALPYWLRPLPEWRCPHCPASGCVCGEIADEVARRNLPGECIEAARDSLRLPGAHSAFTAWRSAYYEIADLSDITHTWLPDPDADAEICVEHMIAAQAVGGITVVQKTHRALVEWALEGKQ